MPCFYPLDAWQTIGGDIRFYATGSRRKGTAAKEFRRDIKLPCGRCHGCRLNRATQWATRCLHESQLHESNCFLTLTLKPIWDYAPPAGRLRLSTAGTVDSGEIRAELPTIAPNGLEGPNIAHMDNSAQDIEDPTAGLSIKTHQKFMKRMREKIGPVRFYMCGEYGEKLDRPHYHYLVFGYDFPDKYYYKTSESGEKLYRSSLLETLWPFGHAWIGSVTYESCAYVASYVMKKITGDQADWHYRRTDERGEEYWLQPEFNLMSRGGKDGRGIAAEWWDKFNNDVTAHDAIVHPGGFKAKPPRYYDKLLELMDPKMFETLKAQREARAKLLRADNTPERLRVKEVCALARMKLKKRQLETDK